MKKYITIIVVILIWIFWFIYLKNNESSQVNTWEILIEKNNIDLGEIKINDWKVEVKFSFKNNRNESIKILEWATSCMCTNAYIQKDGKNISPKILMPGMGWISAKINLEVKPWEKLDLLAIFDPLAHGPNWIWPIKRDIVLETNSTKTPEVIFSFLWDVIK